MDLVRDWFRRHLNDPQVVVLTVLLIVITLGILFVADMLVPVIAALVIAYLLQGIVARVERAGVPHLIAVITVFLAFLAFVAFVGLAIIPLLVNQIRALVQQVPSMLVEAQDILHRLPERYPTFFTEAQIDQFIGSVRSGVVAGSQALLSYSVASLVGVVTLLVYAILVPFLVFFMLKDGDRIVAWMTAFLPRERHLTAQVWQEVDEQLGNFVRGKFWEILIVGAATYVTFFFLGVQYALLLAVLTGVSVLIPYVGATVVTLPVALLAYFQFGWSIEFAYVLIAYGVIQALDGNVLVPILFSEAVSLHPVAIIVAILFFGGLWGFWGVFFAIPLATVVQAVIRAWPRRSRRGRDAAERPESRASPGEAAQ
ncbi:MAG: AI-2E family transporter [Azospirillaceae bacterium]